MTPAQFRAILDAAILDRPEECISYGCSEENYVAIVATMNIAGYLADLWEALHSTGYMYRVDSHDKVERKIADVLKRLEEFKP